MDSVYEQVQKAREKTGVEPRPNFTFHRQASHPGVDRHGPAMVPGWNSSNAEIRAAHQDACYVIWDRTGALAFRGRLTFEQVEELVGELLGRR